MLAFDEAREQILQRARQLKQANYQPLDQALGRVLAEDIVAPIDVPSADNSAMDGVALQVGKEIPAGSSFRVSARIAAGSAPQPLEPGTAVRIFTGAVIPAGANAVVPQEEIRLVSIDEPRPGAQTEQSSTRAPAIEVGATIELTAAVQAGQHVRSTGADIRCGHLVLHRGTRLNPQSLGLLASLGINSVPVYEQLKVGVVCTGDELVAPCQPLAPGQIYDSSSTLLSSLLRQCDMQPVLLDRLEDNLEATCASLREAAGQVDVLISSGGVSVGEEDHVRDALQRIGELHMWRIAVKPGKPLAVGIIGNTPFFGLPGNPVSGFITYLMLVLPFLKLSAGQNANPPQPFMLPAAFDHSGGGRTEFLRARVEQGKVHIYANQGSGVLTSVQWAQGLVRQEANRPISAGDLVPYWTLESLM